GLAGVGLRRCHQPADNSDAASFRCNVLRRFAVMSHKGGALHEIAWWISAHGKFGEKDQPCALSAGASGVLNDLRRVSSEVANCRINLSQRELHTSSLTGERQHAKDHWPGPPGCGGVEPLLGGKGIGAPGPRCCGASSPGRLKVGAFVCCFCSFCAATAT